jgi:transposase-like protein
MKEMAQDPEQQSDYADQDEREDGIEEKLNGVEVVVDPEHPSCPRCGWHNTRLSHTRSMLDAILRPFALRAFRCRSCGNRFRVIRRVPRV